MIKVFNFLLQNLQESLKQTVIFSAKLKIAKFLAKIYVPGPAITIIIPRTPTVTSFRHFFFANFILRIRLRLIIGNYLLRYIARRFFRDASWRYSSSYPQSKNGQKQQRLKHLSNITKALFRIN